MNKKNISRVFILAILIAGVQILMSCESSSGLGKNNDGNKMSTLSEANSYGNGDNLSEGSQYGSDGILDFTVISEYDSDGNLSISPVFDPYES